jgi:hypothetical protein
MRLCRRADRGGASMPKDAGVLKVLALP